MREKAKSLRQNQTDAERLLWYQLRNRRLAGFKFRRQHSIGPFIADFVCLERNLVVELDGGQHASMAKEDGTRTAFLEANGFKVLRFWNNDVLIRTESVVEVIFSHLSKADAF